MDRTIRNGLEKGVVDSNPFFSRYRVSERETLNTVSDN